MLFSFVQSQKSSALVAFGFAAASASAQTSPLVHFTFDDVAGTPVASFDLDPATPLDDSNPPVPVGDGIFETPSALDSSGNDEPFLGFANSSGFNDAGNRLDGIVTNGSGLLVVGDAGTGAGHNSNSRDNARINFAAPVNGEAGGFESATATLLIDSWDFSQNPIGAGNDPEQIRFGFGHGSATNSAAQVWLTRSLFGVELQAQNNNGTGGDVQTVGTQVFGLTQSDPVSLSVTLDETTDTYSIDYQIMDGSSAAVNFFSGNLGAISSGTADADGLRGGHHLRLSFEGIFADDDFYIDDVIVTGVPVAGGGILGDYNNSGQVEQGDLDLVLQNWGLDTDANGVPAGWSNDLPSGQIEQTELDGVLSNWGSTGAPDFSGSSVPEPASAVLLGVLGATLARRSCRRGA